MAKTTLSVIGLIIAFAGTSVAGEWQIEKLDQGAAGKFSSMKVDKDGNVHVVYVLDDGAQNPVRYAFWDHSVKRWFQMTIGKGGSFCSLTLDSQQHPHVSYVDAGTQPGARLRYAYWDGGSWKTRPVDLGADIIAYYSSIALDAQDRPNISFYEYTGPPGSGFRVRMRMVKWNGKYWEVETVDGDNQSGKFNDLAIDAQGHKHLAYANVNGTTAGVRYGVWDGTSWRLEMLEGLPAVQTYVGYSMSIALDREGDPHISYSHYAAPFYIKYAVRKAGRWQMQVVDQVSGVGYPDRNSIFVDSAGNPYISYFDAGQGTLKLARRENQKWIVETVDRNGVGYTSSVRVQDGTIWISYADEAGGGLKIARRTLDAGPIAPPALVRPLEPKK